MKKALLGQKEVFLWKQKDRVGLWDFDIDEILQALNEDLEQISKNRASADPVLPVIRDWVSRYFSQDINDTFLNDLNSAMQEIRYSKYILPLDLLPSESGFPRNGYIADLDQMPSPEAYAADEFSKILSSGMLKRVKRCEMEGCRRFFVGPPQARWCSKACGSKHRVRSKRKRDSG